jgi:hypothetical protein
LENGAGRAGHLMGSRKECEQCDQNVEKKMPNFRKKVAKTAADAKMFKYLQQNAI